jgi:hypothetical protein
MVKMRKDTPFPRCPTFQNRRDRTTTIETKRGTPHAAIVPSERKGVGLRVWIAPQQVGKVRLEFL